MKQNIVYSNTEATIQLPHYKYVDRVLASNSFEELWWRFKDAESPTKEISESFAALVNLKKVCIIDNSDWLHIGDGAYTRTAAMFAFFSKSFNFSIDPQLNTDKFLYWKQKYSVKNIWVFKSKFENILNVTIKESQPLIDLNTFDRKPYSICCVHAHINLEKVDQQFPEWRYLYSNICCLKNYQTFSDKYMRENDIVKIAEGIDLGILSHQREFVIYKKLVGK